MFRQARLRLTVLYSAIFLILFWTLSLGIYFWMNRYFGDKSGDYYVHVHHARELMQNEGTSEPPSDIVMDELKNVLLILDLGLFLIIPTITWFLTGKTLAPVQQAHEKEKQFLTDVSHDLRTPLSILSSGIEVTLQKERTKEEYKETLRSNKEEVDDLIALVENMLFLSRTDTPYQREAVETVDITDLLTERIAAFQNLAKQKKLHLSFDLPEQSSSITGNTQLIKRLFTGLLDNAIKYTEDRGKVSVKLSENKQAVTVWIKDTGIGIPEEALEKVFDRFYRGDTSRTKKGYGLGLSIAKQIVEAHKGEISLESTVDKGTTVTIILPKSEDI